MNDKSTTKRSMAINLEYSVNSLFDYSIFIKKIIIVLFSISIIK